MADRMIVMNAGVAEQIGTPLEVYETPRTLFAAQFIGSPAMNILDAELRDGQVWLNDVAVCAKPGPTGPIHLGIRPEHVVPDPEGPLALSVKLSEPLGANTLLHGQLMPSATGFTASLAGVHHAGREGAELRFSVNADEVHLFDKNTGTRLNSPAL